jgi:hypothetical protein
MRPTEKTLDAALSYVARGWHIFPVAGKRPLTAHGLKDASTDPRQVRAWWSTRPDAGVAIATGNASGLLVLDVDGHQGADTLHELEQEHGELPETVRAETGGGGTHFFFRHDRGVRNSVGRLGLGLDVRGDGGYVVAPPSAHPSGRRYEWDVPPDEGELAEPPAWLLKDAERQRNGAAPKVGPVIPEGKRDATLASLAGTMRRRGMDEQAIAAALKVTNRERCRPPLAEAEVERIAASIGRYEPAEQPEPEVEPEPVAITRAVEVFQHWLYLPDPGIVYAVLGAIAANRLDGDPVWLLAVGPPGMGKTETLQTAAALPDVHPTGVLTEAALLSGTPRRERAKDAAGGLLRTVGDFGIILCKDFGSVLSMQRDSRAQVLAALREIFDGSWTRHVGVEGGRTLQWRGKVGFIGGCTPTIDRHHAVMAAMGERFLLYRLPEVASDEQAARALEHEGSEAQMRDELSAATAGVFAAESHEPRPLTADERERLIALVSFVVRARSPVERDGYRREVELVPEPEAPTRLAKVLARMLAGLDSIGVERELAWRVVVKAGLDCVPKLRLQTVALLSTTAEMTTPKLAAELDYPTSTTKRALEDLTAHRIARRNSRGEGSADTWRLTEQALEWYVASNSEMSEGV